MSKSKGVEVKSATASDAKTPARGDEKEENDASITEGVRGADYYHGLLPRTDVEPLLRKEGDFLLRKTEHQPGVIVLAMSVRHKESIRHFMVNQEEGGTFYFDQHHEKSVSELIAWHRATRTPLTEATPARLSRAVERPPWLLNHDALKIVKKIGEGAFGEVYLAEYTTGAITQEVATKTMREQATREARLKFMKEARLMRRFQHKNIVRILGVAVHEHPLMLVLELCPGGSLIAHLRANKGKTTAAAKLRFITEAAKGLEYLERQKCIHRDVAARNCLLSAQNDVKIADFGMSDDRVSVQDEKLEKVPVKWLAIETMQNRTYTPKTDVWSFGILCWEVYADGAEPYPGLTNMQTRAKIVVHNYRMEMPRETPPPVVKLVAACWEREPCKRPDFATIVKTLLEIRDWPPSVASAVSKPSSTSTPPPK